MEYIKELDEIFLREVIETEREEAIHKYNTVVSEIKKYRLKLNRIDEDIKALKDNDANIKEVMELKREYRAILLIKQHLDKLRVELVKEGFRLY